MDLQRYILYLYTVKERNPKLGDADKDCLARFGLSTHTSTWQCYKYTNLENHKISYKNVYKRVRKFYELGLIEKRVNRTKTKHNAIYYQLTSFGIFYLFKNGFGKKLLEGHTLVNYKSDMLFKTLLHPYISNETINKIRESYYIIIEISKYLSEQCRLLDSHIKYLVKVENDKGIIRVFVCTWHDITNFEKKHIFYSFLNYDLHLSWINNATPARQIKEDLIMIGTGNKSLHLKLDCAKHKAHLYQKSTKLFEFEVEDKPEGEFNIIRLQHTTLEKEIENFKNVKTDILQGLCLGIIRSYNGRYAETIQEDKNIELEFKTLCQDAQFIDAFKRTKLEIIWNMDAFMRENRIGDQI